MALTSIEKKSVASGEHTALVRAVKAGGAPTSALLNIAAGDTQVLAKQLGATGVIARAIATDDIQNLPANVMGLL